ncbi:Phosphohistidine phosphatase SixA [Alloactinosynnema sp. L-07]|uniref:SixA phosphatase family protein n=1 Tax=Alloactinosynnema sp. L-07 TaxID=1653480 RepID=UPI00065EF167|nr:histidine phosphatase family protein [Alloactinosynnema sp. L-07]CRK61934.1 Phosphohistidine phosphatase SixA [Alloactinosynnema sp. L-07]
MPRLVILRHAKSAWPDGVPDYRRPLADRGRGEAPAVGRWLAKHVPDIDVALVSPATRTRQTWELVAAELHRAPKARFEEQLYGEGADAILALLRSLDAAETVLVVGHNPDLELLIAALTGEQPILKTSTLSVLDCAAGFKSGKVVRTEKIRP